MEPSDSAGLNVNGCWAAGGMAQQLQANAHSFKFGFEVTFKFQKKKKKNTQEIVFFSLEVAEEPSVD